MKKFKKSSKKPAAASTSSRRKFLIGMGAAAAVAAVAAIPAVKAIKSIRGNKLASAKTRAGKRPAFLAGMRPLKVVQKLSRPAGTFNLPLDVRPV